MSAHLDGTHGAAFIGMVLAGILYGVTCVQTFYYFINQNDHWYIKSTVTVVMVLDTLHQALITHTVYTYTVTDWGNPDQLQLVVWSIVLEVIVTGLTAFIVQSFLTMRIWRLSGGNVYITCTSMILVFGGFVSVFVYTVKSFQFKDFASLAKIKGISIPVNVLGVVSDLLITATLCTLLHTSRTGYHKSDAMIDKLILFSVNTGVLTSICAVVSLITILASPDTFVYLAFFFCLGRLYTNSLLATLNARKMIRDVGSETSVNTMSVSLGDLPNRRSMQRQNLSIKFDTNTQDVQPDNDHKLHEEISGLPNVP